MPLIRKLKRIAGGSVLTLLLMLSVLSLSLLFMPGAFDGLLIIGVAVVVFMSGVRMGPWALLAVPAVVGGFLLLAVGASDEGGRCVDCYHEPAPTLQELAPFILGAVIILTAVGVGAGLLLRFARSSSWVAPVQAAWNGVMPGDSPVYPLRHTGGSKRRADVRRGRRRVTRRQPPSNT